MMLKKKRVFLKRLNLLLSSTGATNVTNQPINAEFVLPGFVADEVCKHTDGSFWW